MPGTVVTKPIAPAQLQSELVTAGVAVPNGIGTAGRPPYQTGEKTVYTFDDDGAPADLPADAAPVLAAHVAPAPSFLFVASEALSVIVRTVDDTETTVALVPAAPVSIYRADLQMSAMDAGNGACKFMEGRLVWKRLTGVNVIAPPGNITVVSDIHDTAAASWIMNGLPSGGSFRIFVKGVAGRTIDWALTGTIARYAPGGLEP